MSRSDWELTHQTWRHEHGSNGWPKSEAWCLACNGPVRQKHDRLAYDVCPTREAFLADQASEEAAR